jgi:predicted dehydrogenase
MLRLGIIGCGRVTSMFHLKAIHQIDEIKVTALSDVNEGRMKDVRDDCGASCTYLDYSELLSDENVDAVAVNTSPRFHEAIVLDALRAGKHVLCEKPLAETVEGCRKIKRLQQETGLMVLPAHNYVFSPSLVEMIKVVNDCVIGGVSGIDLSFENLLKSYRSQTNFRENMENGIVEDVLPHILSVVYPLVGHIGDVGSVNWWCKDYDVCDNMKAELTSKTGVPIHASMSWTKLRPRFSVSVKGERGSLYTDLMINPYKLDVKVDKETTQWKEKGIKWYLDLVQFKHPSFKNQYQHFYQLIIGGGSPLISVDDEINILVTMDKISEKMRQ